MYLVIYLLIPKTCVMSNTRSWLLWLTLTPDEDQRSKFPGRFQNHLELSRLHSLTWDQYVQHFFLEENFVEVELDPLHV